MKLFTIPTVIFLLICFAVSTPTMGQTSGGRKREHKNQRSGGKMFKFKKRSGGHADAFAKGGRKKGFIARVFGGNKSGSTWVYKKTNPGVKQNREQPQLFTRNRTKSKRYIDGALARQNKQRAGSRVRGNQSFSKSKR